MSRNRFTLQQAGVIIMMTGGITGAGTAIIGVGAGEKAFRIGSSISLFTNGLGLILSGVGDLKDREKTLGELNIRANLDASGKILLGNGLMLSSIPMIAPASFEDSKLLYAGIGLLLVSGSACLGIAQDKGSLMNW
jgi:hypothetical protein